MGSLILIAADEPTFQTAAQAIGAWQPPDADGPRGYKSAGRLPDGSAWSMTTPTPVPPDSGLTGFGARLEWASTLPPPVDPVTVKVYPETYDDPTFPQFLPDGVTPDTGYVQPAIWQIA